MIKENSKNVFWMVSFTNTSVGHNLAENVMKKYLGYLSKWYLPKIYFTGKIITLQLRKYINWANVI